MRLRSRELYIIAAVVAVVLVVAWWFLMFSPKHKQVSDLNAKISSKQGELIQAQGQVAALKRLEKTAPQVKSDLVRLNKALPADTQIPGFIRDITQTAKASGLTFVSLVPGPTTPGTVVGQSFSVQTINVTFTGRYFDVEDFLYRLENYVDYRNGQFLVTGRMFQVANLGLNGSTGSEGLPNLTIVLSINGYLWTPAGSPAAAAISVGGQ